MAADTREKILQVAAKLIVRQGYTATSVNQIARDTGIGKATVYHHFPDKRAIVTALLERNSGRLRAVLADRKAERDPRRQIESVALAAVRMRSETFDLFQVIRREVPDSRPVLHAQLASFLEVYMREVTKAIGGGIRRGMFRPVDPAQAARALLAMITGLYVQIYLGAGSFPDPEKTIRSMLEIFFRGIESRGRGKRMTTERT
ncbi:MAG: TetR/AcrR family transcriptional regulator [Anaerolineales bacterium]|nr:TetR/AcrR family transcriptional regulator [Anaerolineales bacterium]